MEAGQRNILPLPRDADRCMRLVQPVLKRFFNPERFIIGGGSALAARWRHRVSTDVDLFTESGSEARRLHAARSEIKAAVRESCGHPVSVAITPQHGEIAFPGASTLEWSAVARLTPEPVAPDFEPVSGLPLDSNEEILAQKLYSRMFVNGNRPIRDIYDLAWAADRVSPDFLRPAVQTFTTGEFEVMLKVLTGIRDGHFPVDRSKAIIEPAEDLFELRASGILCRELEKLRPSIRRANREGPRAA